MKLNPMTLHLICLAVAGSAGLVGGPSALSYEDQLIGVGINIWLVQFIFWFVIILVVSHLALFLLAPLSWVLRGLVTGALAARFRSDRTRRLEPRGV